MSDLFSGNEEFEKVDADQDENVTSTSMTGDMAEEDRYSGSGAQNDIDLLGDFAGSEASNEANSSEPLISLGTPIQESVSEFPPTLQPVSQKQPETVTEKTPTVQGEVQLQDTTTQSDEGEGSQLCKHAPEDSQPNNRDSKKSEDASKLLTEATSIWRQTRVRNLSKVTLPKVGGCDSMGGAQGTVSVATADTSVQTEDIQGVMGLPGVKALCCWMKTVDPRDDIKDMEEPSPSDTCVTSPVNTAESQSQPSVSGESTGNTGIISDVKFESESDSSSVISSSDNEYSSSADESDTESSNSPSENLDVTDRKVSQDTCKLNEISTEKSLSVDTQSNIKEGNRERLSVKTSGLEDFNKKMEVTSEITGANAPEIDQETLISETVSRAELLKGDAKECVADCDKSEMDATGLSDEPEGASVNVYGDNIPQLDNTVGISEADMLDIIDKLTKEDDTVEQSPEYESDLLFGNLNENKGARDPEYEKFVRGEAPSFDSISPVVSDNEECESLESKSSSNHSNSESDNSCTDSDVSGDEAVVGTWSPSPLYSETFGNFEDEGQNETAMDVEEQNTDVLAGYEYAGEGSEAELSSLRADVKGLMEEMEAIVQDTEKGDTEKSGDFIRAVVTDIDNSVRISGDEETVPEVISKSEPLASIMASGTRERSKTPEGELLHVKFQTPTNTLFYDPECPIVEKVSVEVSDDLIDYDEEQESFEGTSEEQMGNVVDEDLESKVVEDLKDVYDNLEAQGRIEGAMDLIKDSGITNMGDIALQFAKDVLEQARNERLSRETSKAERDPKNWVTDKVDQQLCIEEQDNIESEKLKQMTSETSKQYAPEKDRTNISLNNNEEVVIPERRQTVSVGPFKDYIEKETVEPEEMLSYGLKPESHFLQNMISEKEATNTTEEMLKENTVTGLKENQSINEKENESVNEEPVVLRRKKVKKVESEMSERNEVESMIIHDVELPPERDVQSMIIHDNVECKLHDVLSSFTRNLDEVSSDEKCEEIDIKSSETEHFKVGLDELEVRHLRRLSSASTEEHANVTDMVNESKISLKKTIENECLDVFSKKSEDEHFVLSNEIKSRNIDTKISESSDNINIQMEKKERQDLSFSGRTAELMQSIYREVLDLIYWRDVKKTGVVFGSMMFFLLSLIFFTILSVLAYLSLAILTVTLSFRIYKNVMQAVQKTNEGHPFKKLLELDIALQGDVVENAADKIATNINNCSCELRRLFLVEDYVDSLKFGLLLWLMTYIGSWFNGMTLVILAVVCIFTLPKIYETYQGPIDQNVNLVRGQLNNILKQVSSKIPFPKKKAKTQ